MECNEELNMKKSVKSRPHGLQHQPHGTCISKQPPLNDTKPVPENQHEELKQERYNGADDLSKEHKTMFHTYNPH